MTRKILKGVAIAGVIVIGAQSPAFVAHLWRNILKGDGEKRAKERKKFSDAFSYLKRQGYINEVKKNHQIYISLSGEGKKRMGKDNVDTLTILRQKKWDRRWRMLLFDIPTESRNKREAFRGKLIELGFSMLQKSVWIHPYKCKKELEILKHFFGFDEEMVKMIEVTNLGTDEERFRRKYKL